MGHSQDGQIKTKTLGDVACATHRSRPRLSRGKVAVGGCLAPQDLELS